jgi:hypothetical protein
MRQQRKLRNRRIAEKHEQGARNVEWGGSRHNGTAGHFELLWNDNTSVKREIDGRSNKTYSTQ